MESLPHDVLVLIAEHLRTWEQKHMHLVCKSLRVAVEGAAVCLYPMGKVTGAQLSQLCARFPRAISVDLSLDLGRRRDFFQHSVSSLDGMMDALLNLPSLENLSLNKSRLSELPPSFGNLPALQILDLSGCPYLATLPEEIRRLSLLRKLDLSSCESLVSLPESISGLSSLETLLLTGCGRLEALPGGIGALGAVQTLDLKRCYALGSLPPALGQLGSLRVLNLRGCSGLASIPEAFSGLSSLQDLNLSACDYLVELPEGLFRGMGQLRKLNLGSCEELLSLPESLTCLAKLEHLNLSWCISLESLPLGFAALRSLGVLNLRHCIALPNVDRIISRVPQIIGDESGDDCFSEPDSEEEFEPEGEAGSEFEEDSNGEDYYYRRVREQRMFDPRYWDKDLYAGFGSE